MGAIFAPAVITHLEEVDPGEIRVVELTLPRTLTVGGDTYRAVDRMRPGTAFLAEPFGSRTQKRQKRLYTRSNCFLTAPGVLQTIINNTHDNPDTSIWWQTEDARVGDTLSVRVELVEEGKYYPSSGPSTTLVLVPYEHRIKDETQSLALEIPQCFTMRYVAFAFSTGITPFLSHLRFFAALKSGKGAVADPTHYTLFMSAKKPRQLICHEELMQLIKEFPENFVYHPVLTREWPENWPFTTGRIIRATREKTDAGKEPGKILSVDISQLLSLMSEDEIAQSHIRMCGGKSAREELLFALKTRNIRPLSFKAEVW